MAHDRQSVQTEFLVSLATSGQFKRLITYLASSEPRPVRKRSADLLSQSVDSLRAQDSESITDELYTAALTEPSDTVRATIIETLLYLDDQAIDTFVERIEATDTPTPTDTPHPLVYSHWLDSKHVELRLVAVAGLGQIGSKQVVPKLAAACTDSDSRIRIRALTECGKLGDPRCVTVATTNLSASSSEVRMAAAVCLVRIGTAEALDTVLSFVEEADGQVQHAVLEQIGSVGSLHVFGVLLNAIKSGDPTLQPVAVRSAVQLMANAPSANSHTVRLTVGTHFDCCSEPTIVPHLQPLLEAAPPQLRRNAAWLLGRLIDPTEHTESLTTLITAIGDEDVKTAKIAVSQLAELDDPAVVERVEALVQTNEFGSQARQRAKYIQDQITQKTATDHRRQAVEFTKVSDPADYTRKHADDG